jgi:valyl-tRNA synthetase
VADPFRVLTSPVRVTGGLRLAQLVTLATGDAVATLLERAGRAVEWSAGVLAGDLSSQLAVEQELAREGLDRVVVGRDDFVARARAAEADGRAQATELLASLGISVDLDAGALDNEAVALAARTAFVRLYEAGQLTRLERVVSTCPRCVTVVDDIDVEVGTSAADRHRLHLDLATGDVLELDIVATELLPGAVALAVPLGHEAEGTSLEVPIAGRSVPVLADPDATEPRLVVPAHNESDLELARRQGLLPVMVLDGEGTVVVPGPLESLGRYAARAAAAELLVAEGVVEAVDSIDEEVSRCRRCGTIVVPRLGRHWFLPMVDLEVLAADAVRQGAITVTPAGARDELVAAAGQRGDWCLSHQVWAGQPVPVGTCLDCGQAAVSVEPTGSCGKCMGTVVADDDVLDARFVGAIWPLALAGWPQDEGGPAAAASDTLLIVAPTGLILWAVRMAGLGLRLAGAAPFTCIGMHPSVDPELPIEQVRDVAAAAAAVILDA